MSNIPKQTNFIVKSVKRIRYETSTVQEIVSSDLSALQMPQLQYSSQLPTYNRSVDRTLGMQHSYRVTRAPIRSEQLSDTETAPSEPSESTTEAGRPRQQYSLNTADATTVLGRDVFEDPLLLPLPHPDELFGKKRKKSKEKIQKSKVNKVSEHLAQIRSIQNKLYPSDSETPTKERPVVPTSDRTESDDTNRKLFNDIYRSPPVVKDDTRSVLPDLSSSVLDADIMRMLSSNRDNHHHFRLCLQHED